MWCLPGVLGFLAAGFGFLAVWHYFGREVVELAGGAVQVTRNLGGFQRRWTVSLDEITGVEVPALGREFVNGSWGVGMPSLYIRTRRKTIRCCIAVPPAHAQRIGATIWEAAQHAATGRTTMG